MMWVRLILSEKLKYRILYTSTIVQRQLCTRIRSKIKQENILVLKEIGIHENQKTFNKYASRDTRLKLTVDMVKSLGFPVEALRRNIQILGHSPNIIDHRFKAFEEAGLQTETITLKMIRCYRWMGFKSVFDLKIERLLDKNIDVVQNILSFCNMPPALHPSNSDETSSLQMLQAIAFKTYLEWRLDTNKEEIDAMFRVHPYLFNKSIRLMIQVCDILINDVGLSLEKIRRNAVLLQCHPDHVRNFLESFPVIGEKPIRKILQTTPKILMVTVDNLRQTLLLLEEYKISGPSVSLVPQILILSPHTIQERLEQITASPEFQPYLHSHRICSLLVYYNKARSRLKLLKDAKWRSYTLNKISGNAQVFEGSFKMGSETTKGLDTITYLHKELMMKRKEVRDLLIQHPFWNYVPTATVSATLVFLRNAGYNHFQIVQALPVLFYPKSEVARQLEILLGEEIGEVDCCRDPITGKLQPQLLLQLVLYYLERPYHFTGNGVWVLSDLPEPPPADL